MASILAGLEFIAETSTFIGFTTQKLIYDCRVLATVYGQWVSENLDHINDKHDTMTPPPPSITMDTKKTNIHTHPSKTYRYSIYAVDGKI